MLQNVYKFPCTGPSLLLERAFLIQICVRFESDLREIWVRFEYILDDVKCEWWQHPHTSLCYISLHCQSFCNYYVTSFFLPRVTLYTCSTTYCKKSKWKNRSVFVFRITVRYAMMHMHASRKWMHACKHNASTKCVVTITRLSYYTFYIFTAT